MDAEELRFANESFDSVTNAHGLMFCPNPELALGEMHRVLRPGGRAALATWDEPAKSPYFAAITGVAATHLSLPPPNPADPGPFRLTSSDRLESLLRGSRFSDVRVESFPLVLECESVDQYCQIFADVAWKAKLASLGDAAAARFRDAVAEAAEPYRNGSRLQLVAASLCVSGTK
jgi:SAM-dependent methyltransferase